MSSATEAVRLVRAVAEGLVRRAAAAAERRPLALVEQLACRVDDSYASGYQQGPVRGCANLERLLPLRVGGPDPACLQRPGRAEGDRGLDLVGRGRIDLDPWPPAFVEHPRQRPDAVLGVKAQARLPLHLDLVRGVLLRDVVPLRAHPRLV